MKTLSFILFVAFALVACNSSKTKEPDNAKTPPHRKPTASAATQPLAMELAQKAGHADVALIATAAGLEAVSSDGKFARTLVAGTVLWALPDNKIGGVWFMKEEKGSRNLYLLPLLEKGPALLVVKGYPFKDLDSYPVYVEYDKQMRSTGSHNFEAALKIQYIKGKASLGSDFGPLAIIDEERKAKYEKQLKALKIESPAALTALFKKGANRTLIRKSPKTTLKTLPIDPAPCGGQKDVCGAVQLIPGSSIHTVMVEHSCGDSCYFKKVWYDSATKKYIDPMDVTKTATTHKGIKGSFEYGVSSPKGEAILHSGMLINFKKGTIRKNVKAGGGWLGGGFKR